MRDIRTRDFLFEVRIGVADGRLYYGVYIRMVSDNYEFGQKDAVSNLFYMRKKWLFG